MSWFQRAKRVLFGAPRNIFDPKVFHQISLIALFAWVGLGADGISSSAYGPEEAFLALGDHTVLAIFVALATVFTVFVISGSYAQIIEAFPGLFRNFVFLSAGVIDSSRFKGAEEVANLGSDLENQLRHYVEFVRSHGSHAEARHDVGTDVIEIITNLADGVARDYPNVTVFAGKLVFREENFMTRLLHNQTSFLVQKKLVHHGLPMLIMPIRAM